MQRLAHTSGEDRVAYLGGQLEVGLTGHMTVFSDEIMFDELRHGHVVIPIHRPHYGQIGAMRFIDGGRLYQIDKEATPQLITPGCLPRKIQGPPAPMIIHDTVEATSISFTGVVPFSGEMTIYIGPRKSFLNLKGWLNPEGDEIDMTDPKLAMVYQKDYRAHRGLVAAAICYADDTIVAVGHKHMTFNLARSGALAVMALEPLGDHDG